MLVWLKEGWLFWGVVLVRLGVVESFFEVVVLCCCLVGGVDLIGGNVLYGGLICVVDFGLGGVFSIVRFCFLGIGGSVFLIYDFKF